MVREKAVTLPNKVYMSNIIQSRIQYAFDQGMKRILRAPERVV